MEQKRFHQTKGFGFGLGIAVGMLIYKLLTEVILN
jgi:hypothetical protein